MKHLFISFFSVISFSLCAQKINCHDVEGNDWRIRIVTLSTPEPWVKIPMAYVVEKEGDCFVFYSDCIGSYCSAVSLLDVFQKTPYNNKVKIVRCNVKNKK